MIISASNPQGNLYGFADLAETETGMIDTPVFRRLRRIKQISHVVLSRIWGFFDPSGMSELENVPCGQA